uniref:Odorant binding protein 3 n=1 Tax=Dendroctonus adjunctus TaxID=77157 RepID=A0A7U3UIL3_9CUCU|nr:Odorant binding protein 3 [Dendroctonus adjunctus]
MVSFVALFVCAFAATALADPEINQSVFEAGRNRVMGMSRSCDENPATAVDQKALEKYLESNGPAPANAGVHALCMSKVNIFRLNFNRLIRQVASIRNWAGRTKTAVLTNHSLPKRLRLSTPV